MYTKENQDKIRKTEFGSRDINTNPLRFMTTPESV